MTGRARSANAQGFSLIELIFTMAILLVMLAGASRLLTSSLATRTRENEKSDALMDAQRALNIMSREIGNSGFGLDYNGLVVADCHPTASTDPMSAQIRFRTNIDNTDTTTNQADEDVTYVYQGAPISAIVRYDKNTGMRTVLADHIAEMKISYVDDAEMISPFATPSAVADAVRVRITVRVDLQAMAGQPASQVTLASDIALRNAPVIRSRY